MVGSRGGGDLGRSRVVGVKGWWGLKGGGG